MNEYSFYTVSPCFSSYNVSIDEELLKYVSVYGAEYGKLDIVKAAIEQSSDKETTIVTASLCGRPTVLEWLAQRFSLNTHDWDVVRYAALEGLSLLMTKDPEPGEIVHRGASKERLDYEECINMALRNTYYIENNILIE